MSLAIVYMPARRELVYPFQLSWQYKVVEQIAKIDPPLYVRETPEREIYFLKERFCLMNVMKY